VAADLAVAITGGAGVISSSGPGIPALNGCHCADTRQPRPQPPLLIIFLNSRAAIPGAGGPAGRPAFLLVSRPICHDDNGVRHYPVLAGWFSGGGTALA
jgi:hypothetical protein